MGNPTSTRKSINKKITSKKSSKIKSRVNKRHLLALLALLAVVGIGYNVLQSAQFTAAAKNAKKYTFSQGVSMGACKSYVKKSKIWKVRGTFNKPQGQKMIASLTISRGTTVVKTKSAEMFGNRMLITLSAAGVDTFSIGMSDSEGHGRGASDLINTLPNC